MLSILTHLIHLVASLVPNSENIFCHRLIHQIVHHIDPRTSSGFLFKNNFNDKQDEKFCDIFRRFLTPFVIDENDYYQESESI